MSKVKFNADEMMVMAMFEQPTRTETMRYIEEVVPFVEDDIEVFSLVASTMKKMRSISDMEFSRLDLKPYLQDQYQVAVQKQEAAFKKVMLAVNDIEKAFSHGNPWLMKFRAISIPEKLERTHLKEWLDHVWIVDFEQVEVILQESKWKGFFPEEWLNNGEEDCNGKKE